MLLKLHQKIVQILIQQNNQMKKIKKIIKLVLQIHLIKMNKIITTKGIIQVITNKGKMKMLEQMKLQMEEQTQIELIQKIEQL